MTDPTNTYEARAEMQADFELEDYMLKKKIFEYMDEYYYVNKSEVEMSAQEARAKTFYPDEPDYQMSYGEIADAQEYAEMYIKEKNIKFDENGDIVNDYKTINHLLSIIEKQNELLKRQDKLIDEAIDALQ